MRFENIFLKGAFLALAKVSLFTISIFSVPAFAMHGESSKIVAPSLEERQDLVDATNTVEIQVGHFSDLFTVDQIGPLGRDRNVIIRIASQTSDYGNDQLNGRTIEHLHSKLHEANQDQILQLSMASIIFSGNFIELQDGRIGLECYFDQRTRSVFQEMFNQPDIYFTDLYTAIIGKKEQFTSRFLEFLKSWKGLRLSPKYQNHYVMGIDFIINGRLCSNKSIKIPNNNLLMSCFGQEKAISERIKVLVDSGLLQEIK